MKKNKRPVRLKRNPFKFKKGFITIMIFEINCKKVVYKAVEAQILGQWAFHTYFKNKYTITHAPTGIQLICLDNEKESKILIKRLYCKIQSNWKPEEKILKDFAEWSYETLELIRGLYGNIWECANCQDITNTEEDLPF